MQWDDFLNGVRCARSWIYIFSQTLRPASCISVPVSLIPCPRNLLDLETKAFWRYLISSAIIHGWIVVTQWLVGLFLPQEIERSRQVALSIVVVTSHKHNHLSWPTSVNLRDFNDHSKQLHLTRREHQFKELVRFDPENQNRYVYRKPFIILYSIFDYVARCSGPTLPVVRLTEGMQMLRRTSATNSGWHQIVALMCTTQILPWNSTASSLVQERISQIFTARCHANIAISPPTCTVRLYMNRNTLSLNSNSILSSRSRQAFPMLTIRSSLTCSTVWSSRAIVSADDRATGAKMSSS